MAAHAYAGQGGLMASPLLMIDGVGAFPANDRNCFRPVLTYRDNFIYRGQEYLKATPIATLIGNYVYKGNGRSSGNPIATLRNSEFGYEVYKGDNIQNASAIATVKGGGRMDAATTAVYLLLK